MEYVMVERVAGQVTQAEVQRKLLAAGARIIRWHGRTGLIAFDGPRAELLARAGALPGWLVSEKRIYRLG